jgi:hypothetical protein
MGVFDAIATGAASALSFLGQERANRQNKDIWRKTQDWDTQQAQTNRDFQERMSNTAWQRGVSDMKAAGINPMLAFSQGGASSPAGSVIGGKSSAPMQNTIGAGVSSAIQSASLIAQLKKNEADIGEVNSRTALNFAQIANTAATTAKARATQPLYNLVRDGVNSLIHSAKSLKFSSVPRGSINLSKGLFRK